MYTTIQHYRVKLGQADQVVRLAHTELLPIIKAIPGFISCQTVVVGPLSIVCITTYSDRSSATVSNTAASQWVDSRLATLIDDPGRATLGEVRLAEGLDSQRSGDMLGALV